MVGCVVPLMVSSTSAWVSVPQRSVSIRLRRIVALPPVLTNPSPGFVSVPFSVIRRFGAVGSADMSWVSTALK
jgi:hypothetical protein